MRITKRDLDPELLEEIERLDNIVSEYKGSESHDGYVSYDGSRFYFKKTNDAFLRRIYTEDEIEELYDYINSDATPRNVVSSKTTDIRLVQSQHNAAEDGFLENYVATPSYMLDGNILKSKVVSDALLIFTSKGYLYKIFPDRMDKIDLNGLISRTFNINKYIINSEITDFAEIDNDTYLISLYSYGIYKLTFSKKSIEYIINEKDIRQVLYTRAKTIFVVTDRFCGFYSASGNCIEKSYNISRQYQIPFKAIQNDSGIYVLGISQANRRLGSSLHGWRLDRSGSNYNCIDGQLPVIEDFNFSTFRSDNEYLYLIGEKATNEYELFKISTKTYECEKHKLPKCPFDVAAISGKYLVTKDNYISYIEFLDSNIHLIRKFKLTDYSDINIKVVNNEIYLLTKSDIIKFVLPEIKNTSEELKYLVFDENTSCNNIDIMIAGAGKNERVTVYDLNNNEVIDPSYYMIYNGNTVIKLINCKATKIYISINADTTTKLDGIVCKHNRLFLR